MDYANRYFDVQAEIGVTKHPAALQATETLIRACHLTPESRVLDIGCGVGWTTCYLASRLGCTVVGVDVAPRMIERAGERVWREGLEDWVELRQADARELPFADGSFDAVISESVTGFVYPKAAAVREYARVARPDAWVGLTEMTWLSATPPREMVEYVDRAIGGIRPETADGWRALMVVAGLREVAGDARRLRLLPQMMQEIRTFELRDVVRSWVRFPGLLVRRSGRRAVFGLMRDAWDLPRGLFQHFGYGIYTGRR